MNSFENPNAFEAFAGATKPVFQERRDRAAATRARTLEKQQRDEAKQLRIASIQEKEELQTVLDGACGEQVQTVLKALRELTLSDANKLIALIERQGRILAAPANTRHIVLRLISRKIVKLREAAGLEPFDDALIPLEAPRAYQVIRAVLGVR